MRNVSNITLLATVIIAALVHGAAHAAAIGLQTATSDYGHIGNAIANTIDGDTASSGWNLYDTLSLGGREATIVWETQTVVDVGELTFTMHMLAGSKQILGRYRLSYTTDNQSLFADGLQIGGDITANWVVLNSPTSLSATNGVTLVEHGDSDGSIAANNPADTSVYTLTYDVNVSGITGFRLEAIADTSLPNDGPGWRDVTGQARLTEIQVAGTALEAGETSIPTPAPILLMLGGVLAMRRLWNPRRC
ncbi:MAG: hypothetical protein ACPGU7_07105 [Gammaproteobacteria bacterium]